MLIIKGNDGKGMGGDELSKVSSARLQPRYLAPSVRHGWGQVRMALGAITEGGGGEGKTIKVRQLAVRRCL